MAKIKTYLDERLINNNWIELEAIIYYDFFEGQKRTQNDPEFPPELTIEGAELLDGTIIDLTENEKYRIENEIIEKISQFN